MAGSREVVGVSDAEPSGLARFGVASQTILREPTRDRRERMEICPEDGSPVSRSIGPQRIHHPDVLPEDVEERPEQLVAFGWRCDRHSYDVVMPLPSGDPRVPDDWPDRGVRVELADGRVREIAAREVDHVE